MMGISIRFKDQKVKTISGVASIEQNATQIIVKISHLMDGEVFPMKDIESISIW